MSWIEQTDATFRGLNLRDLEKDQAYLNITTSLPELFLYSLSAECDKCPFTKIKQISGDNEVLKVDTEQPLTFKFLTRDEGKYAFDNVTELCRLEERLGEFGVYDVIVGEDSCVFSVAKEPVPIHYSLFVAVVIYVAAFFVLKLVGRLAKRWRGGVEATQSEQDKELEKPKPTKKRLKSLDTFRGISIVLMIFVNYGGGGYWWIEHTTWNGLHLADLVFPWFLWIMGVCIPMSIRSQLSREVPKRSIFLNILRRSLILFALGVCLNSTGGPQMADLRIFGVLQRFGVAYFVVSSLQLLFTQSTVVVMPQNAIKAALYDIILIWRQHLTVLVVLVFYLLMIFLFPVPGCARGYVGPGGKHNYLSDENCIGGVTGYIDRILLGDRHIYQRPTAKRVYDSKPFDPEGIFGCLPTILQVTLGLQAGITLFVHGTAAARLCRWLIWGILLGLLGGALSGFSENAGWIPINKNLWSLSFVCVTAGLAFILLSVCFYLIDVRGWWNGEPFRKPGMNSIILYVGHSVLDGALPWRWRIGPMNTHFVRLLENGWATGLWVLIAYYLYAKDVFYSI